MSRAAAASASPFAAQLPSTAARLPDFAGTWCLCESHQLDDFLKGWVARKLAAAVSMRNDIQYEHAPCEGGPPRLVVDVSVAAAPKATYVHPLDGSPYPVRRLDGSSEETARTSWQGDRLVTLTSPHPHARVPPMRSERWIDSQDRMWLSHRVCPGAPESLGGAQGPVGGLEPPASPSSSSADGVCFTTWRVYQRCQLQAARQQQHPLDQPVSVEVAVPVASAKELSGVQAAESVLHPAQGSAP